MKSWPSGKQNSSLQKLTIFIVLFGIVFGGCGTVDLKVRKNLDHPNIHPNTVAILPLPLLDPHQREFLFIDYSANVSLTISVIWVM